MTEPTRPSPATIEPTATTQHRSFCRFCAALCGIVVTTQGETVVEVRGDPEHPISHGYTCPKGRALGAFHHHPQRLDKPLVGRGEQRREMSWNDTLDDLASRIAAIAAEHGPDAVGMYMATATSFDAAGGRVAYRLGQALATKSRYSAVTIDTPCRPLVTDLLSGTSSLMPCLDFDTAGLTLLVGTNPVVSHGHMTSMSDPVKRLRGLATAPRELWVVDPRRTESARLATRHLALRPGSDHALFAYLVRELLGPEGGADRAYLADHADGIEALTAAVETWDLDRAVAETGLDADSLTDLVAAIRRHRRVAVLGGTGTTMSATANATEWLEWALQIITGSYEQPGGLWFQPGFLRCFDRRTIRSSGPDPIEWPRPPSRPDLPGFYSEYPCAAMVDEIEAGNLRALIVIGGNPAGALPDGPRLDAALASLEVLAVADVVHTETTAFATHVLPCVGQLERADVPDFVDQYFPMIASQHTAAVVAPGAERKPVWWISAELGTRLGHRLLPEGLETDTATDDDLLDAHSNRGRLPLDELRAAPTAVIVEGPVRGWVHERVLPGGRWRAAPTALVNDLAALGAAPGVVPGVVPGDHTAGSDDQLVGPDDSLVLLPRRLMRTLNSQLRDASAPGGRLDAPLVLLHPSDAANRGIAEGDRVVVRSATGTTSGTAHLDDGLRPGCISVPHSWADTRVGNLVTSTEGADPLTGMVRQSGIGVTVKRAD
jgi:anaerobic selenocysteine-containing dehydrogenase